MQAKHKRHDNFSLFNKKLIYKVKELEYILLYSLQMSTYKENKTVSKNTYNRDLGLYKSAYEY